MSGDATPSSRTVDSLRRRLRGFEAKRLAHEGRLISSGCGDLDHRLPGGGFPNGSLIECLGAGSHACGAGLLAMIVARQALEGGGELVVLDPEERFYPPAAWGMGVDLEKLVVVRASRLEEQVWALDQALRCSGVAAAWAPVEQLDERQFRRLQLAVEEGGGLGMLIRSRRWRHAPSWAHFQLLITPRVPVRGGGSGPEDGGRYMRIEVARCRHGQSSGGLDVEIDPASGTIRQVSDRYETHPLYSASQLADPATDGCSARAE